MTYGEILSVANGQSAAKGVNMNKIEKMQNKIDKRFPNESITVLEAGTCKDYLKIQCNSCGKIYEFNTAENAYAKRKKACCHNCGTRLEKENNFINKIKEIYPEEQLEIIDFSTRENPCKIKCLKCGEIREYIAAKNALKTTVPYFCKTCHPVKQEIMDRKKQEFINFISFNAAWSLEEENLDHVHSNTLIKCRCTKCNKLNEKTIYDYLRGRRCLCESHTKPITQEEFENNLNSDFEMVSQYTGIYKKIKIRHKSCGFVYETVARNVWKNGGACPKCFKKQSKGEKKIKEFLQQYEIDFIQEYRVKIDRHSLTFDFYLPLQDLYIEFNGIQHYEPVDYFGGESRFKIQQQYDKLKQDFAKEKLITISYLDIDCVFSILEETVLNS